MLVLGARPQIIKSAPIIRAMGVEPEVELQLVHTGQHYDYEMSKLFFNELNLPGPLANLGVGSGGHGWQTGMMMVKLERLMGGLKPSLVLVLGDTNSTLAGALAAVKLHIPVAHVEAGARSYDLRMAEEVNRRLTDHCSSLLFAPTQKNVDNLLKEGIDGGRIFLVGDTMYDALLHHFPKAMESDVLKRLSLVKVDYAVLTMHRPENVDEPKRLKGVLDAISRLTDLKIVFPIHPRTRRRLHEFRLIKKLDKVRHVKLIKPIGYYDMLKLMNHAKLVFTDSGGVQKEAFWLHKPCITLRERTEWVETIELGFNRLVGVEPLKIIQAAREMLADEGFKERVRKAPNPFGDGEASKRIVELMKSEVGRGC